MTAAVFRRIRTRQLQLTQQALADRLRVSRVTVVRWELGQAPIPGPVAILMSLLPRLNPAQRRAVL